MRNKIAAVGAIIGVALAVTGVIVGFANLTQVGQSCGSVFSPTAIGGFSLSATYVTTLCNDAIAGQASAVWTLIIVGGMLLIGSVLGFKRTQSQPAPVAPVPAVQES